MDDKAEAEPTRMLSSRMHIVCSLSYRGSLSRRFSGWWGLCPGGSLSGGVSVQGGSLSRVVSVREESAQGVFVR